jgi:hypothetical protein
MEDSVSAMTVLKEQIEDLDEKINCLQKKKKTKEALLQKILGLPFHLNLRIMFQNRTDGSFLLEPDTVHSIPRTELSTEDFQDGYVKPGMLYKLDRFCTLPGFIAYKAWVFGPDDVAL